MARKMTMDDWLNAPPHTVVRAKRFIHDSPLADTDDSVPKGTLGCIEDYLTSDGLLVVNFEGDRILLVAPDEIEID